MEDTLQRISSAFDALHASQPDPIATKNAQTVLADLKNGLSVPDSLVLAGALLAPLLSPSSVAVSVAEAGAMHFGFHIVEERVLMPDPWELASKEQRARLRVMALEMFSALVRPSTAGSRPSFVRQKVASLIAALGIREWPQFWPDFVEQLVGLARDGGGAMLCLVWRTLSDDVFEFGAGISSARRQDLSKALSIALDTILAHVRGCVDASLQNDDSDGLLVAIGALESLLSWCDMEKAFAAGIPAACVKLLGHPSARDPALEALSVFVARRVPAPASPVSVVTAPATRGFRESLFPAVLDFVSSSAVAQVLVDSFLPYQCSVLRVGTTCAKSTSVDVEYYDFIVRFVSMMGDLGTTHFGVCFMPFQLTPRELEEHHEKVALAFIEFMACCVSHPSIAVREAATGFFSSSIRRPSDARRSSSKGGSQYSSQPGNGSYEAAEQTRSGRCMLSTIVVRFVDAATLSLIEHPTDVLYRGFKDVDFEGDVTERSEVLTHVKAKLLSALGTASAVRSSFIVPMAFDRLQQLLDNVVAALSNGILVLPDESIQNEDLPESAGALATLSNAGPVATSWNFAPFTADDGRLVLACVEGLVSATEAIVAGAFSANVFSSGSDGSRYLEQLATLFEKFERVQDPHFAALKVTTFRMFIPVFLRDTPRLQRALDILLRHASEPGNSAGTRRRAGGSLAAVCRRVAKSSPDALESVRLPLCEFVAPALIQADRTSGEKARLLDAACTCILSHNSLADRTSWMETLLGPVLEYVRLDNDWCQVALQSPSGLYQFVTDGDRLLLCRFIESLFLLQKCTHQVVRDASHSRAAIDLPNPLSSSIAPRTIAFGVKLIEVLHAMYNESKFPSRNDEAVKSSLGPTSREIASILNLDGGDSNYLTSIPSSAVDANGLVLDRSAGSRADDLLARHGLKPPDQRYGRTRETLRILRKGAYELVRNGLLSGVTVSPSHMMLVLNAISNDHQYIEPIHLSYLMNHVVKVLLSHRVVAADPAFLELVETSGVPSILRLVIQLIEGIGESELVAPDDATLDFVREGCRFCLCHDAADLMQGVFPKPPPAQSAQTAMNDVEPERFIPVPLQGTGALSSVLWNLCRTLCSPCVAKSSSGASSRACLSLVGRVVESAPDSCGGIFASLATVCFETSVVCLSGADNVDAAVTAVVEILARFPAMTASEMQAWGRSRPSVIDDMVQKGFTAAFGLISNRASGAAAIDMAGAKKKARATLRRLAQEVGDALGLRPTKRKTVRALGVPLQAGSSRPERRRDNREAEEVMLGDRALDSLFGVGEPL